MFQYPREDLDEYVKRFHEMALYYNDLVVEDVLLDLCLQGLIEDYIIYLENLLFPFSSKLMEAARPTNEPLRKTSRSSSLIWSSSLVRSAPKKRPLVLAIEKSKGALPLQRNNHMIRRRQSNFQFYHPSHAGRRRLQVSSSSGERLCHPSRIRKTGRTSCNIEREAIH